MSNLFCIVNVTLLTLAFSQMAQAVACPVATPRPISDARQAFLHSDYDRAATLYGQALQQHTNDPELTAGLVDVLLEQQKVTAAHEILQKAIAADQKSVVLQTAMGEVQYREGFPWLASQTANAAMAIDPCYARLRLLNMHLLRLNSMHKNADDELHAAHSLDPNDPDIHRHWLQTLPLKQHIAEAEAYLAAPNGEDAESLRRMNIYLEYLKKAAAEPRKSCQLASSNASTEIKFAPLMRDANHMRAFGLDVKLNEHNARLEIDTGASGLLVSRSVANRAGLEAFSKTEVGGIGSGEAQSAYTAYVDSIQIGSLEFHDCAVRVLDARNVIDSDGLIGMDVFSNLLVTLDYPMRKLSLGPLPPRPDDVVTEKPSLQTSETQNTLEENGSKPAETTQLIASPANRPAVKVSPAKGPQNRYVAPEMADWTRVYRSGHTLIIPAKVNETKLKLFILDTGAFTTTISPEAAREVTKLHSNDSLVVRGLSGKVEKVYSADNLIFDFANLRQRADEAVALDTSNISKNTGLEISGFIGITTLGQLTLQIDYRDALVKFNYDPKRGFHPPPRY